MSTSFLVIQAQRDLAQAKQNELAAVLAYVLSLVDFEALQQAGPQESWPGAAVQPIRAEANTTPAAGAPPLNSAPPPPSSAVHECSGSNRDGLNAEMQECTNARMLK